MAFIARVRRDLVDALTSLFGLTIAVADNAAAGESFFPMHVNLLVTRQSLCMAHVLFLNKYDEKVAESLKYSAECLGEIQMRELDPIETSEHTIVYIFSSNAAAIDTLERIAVLAEAFFGNTTICQSCQLSPQSSFLSLRTDVDDHQIVLRVCQTAKRLRSLVSESIVIPCLSCDNQKPQTVYQLITIIKNELSISPSNISLESKSPSHHNYCVQSKSHFVFSTVILKEGIYALPINSDERKGLIYSWMKSKPWLPTICTYIENFYTALSFPSRLPCPHAALTLEIDEGNNSLSLSAQIDNKMDMNSLCEEEKIVILERLHFYGIVDLKVKKLDHMALEDISMQSICVSAMVICLDSLPLERTQ